MYIDFRLVQKLSGKAPIKAFIFLSFLRFEEVASRKERRVSRSFL